jgi:broad specificity phosphatase PhoE
VPSQYGSETLALIEDVFAQGVGHVAALIRHSAREFEAGRHDLLNPLTDEGRTFARAFGKALPKGTLVRGYTSPAERCVETVQLILEGHGDDGGRVTRHRPIEALGVFYVLDQMKMYRAMTSSPSGEPGRASASHAASASATGQVPFLSRWFAGEIGSDVMMPADVAAKLVGRVVAGKLEAPLETPQLDVCVSHDMSLYLVRDRLLGLAVDSSGPVDFLDGVVFYERDGRLWMRGLRGAERAIDLAM